MHYQSRRRKENMNLHLIDDYQFINAGIDEGIEIESSLTGTSSENSSLSSEAAANNKNVRAAGAKVGEESNWLIPTLTVQLT